MQKAAEFGNLASMKTAITIKIIVITAVFGMTSCASIKTERTQGESLIGKKTFYVERLDGEESGLHRVIADELSLLGFAASAGEEGRAPQKVDALVTYWDKWFWDITPYLLQLDIRIIDPKTRNLIAKGTSYRPSLQRRSPKEMVKETLNAIFAEKAEQAAP